MLFRSPALLFIYIVVNSLVISQLTKFAMAITGVNVLVNIIGNIILLPRYGIIAAAGMTIASEALQGIFYFYFVRKKITDFRFFSLIWQPALASLIMGFVVWNMRSLNLFIVVAAAVLVYGLILLILRFFKKDDIQFVKSLLSRAV